MVDFLPILYTVILEIDALELLELIRCGTECGNAVSAELKIFKMQK
jgi:hypothetical protein